MNLDTLNWIDVALGGILIISALIGLMRGFVKEILSLIAWGVAAYAAFEESDDVAATGKRFWQEILAVGGSRSAAESFKAFRGREPSIDALLRHSGFDNAA